MTERLYQHAKSTDPEVIATVERNWAGRVAAMERCREWAAKYGDGKYYVDRTGGHGITSLPLKERPEGAGQWVWNYRRDGFLPGSRNPLRKEMEEIGYTDEKVPGLHGIVISGDSYFLTSTPFVINGAAWIMYARRPGKGYGLGEQWHEIKASEAHAAKEAWEEAHK